MAEQIGLMAGPYGREEAALRVGYDDINESMCIHQVRQGGRAQQLHLQPTAAISRSN